MGKEIFISWSNRYELGLQIIDDQHKELVRLTNALHETCCQGKEFVKSGFQTAVQATVDYVGKHFSAEEKIMQQVNYPHIAEHKLEHEKFVKKVLQDVKDFQEGKTFVPNKFAYFLKDWILGHIALTDKKLVDYLLKIKTPSA